MSGVLPKRSSSLQRTRLFDKSASSLSTLAHSAPLEIVPSFEHSPSIKHIPSIQLTPSVDIEQHIPSVELSFEHNPSTKDSAFLLEPKRSLRARKLSNSGLVPPASLQPQGSFNYPSNVPVTMCSSFSEVMDVHEQLGQGSFGTVKRCTSRDNLTKAVKVISEKNYSNFKKMLEQEVSIMSTIGSHPNLLCLENIIRVPGKCFCLVTEMANNGDLMHFIQHSENHYIPDESVVLDVLEQIVDGLSALHSQHVAHRDIKPENILITEISASGVPQIKICDFGTAARCPPFANLTKACGTPFYLAPEVLFHLPYNKKCDIWSLGVTLYVMTHGHPPFPAKSIPELQAMILNTTIKIAEDVSDHMAELIVDLLECNPKSRIDIFQVKQRLQDIKRQTKRYKKASKRFSLLNKFRSTKKTK